MGAAIRIRGHQTQVASTSVFEGDKRCRCRLGRATCVRHIGSGDSRFQEIVHQPVIDADTGHRQGIHRDRKFRASRMSEVMSNLLLGK